MRTHAFWVPAWPAPARRGSAPLLALSLLAPACLAGCAPSPSHQHSSPAVTVSTPVPPADGGPIPAVRRTALYRQAERDCRRRDFLGAAHRLERLAATPGLPPEAALFCRQQRALCLQDAGRPAPAPVLAPSVRPPSLAPRRPDQADCGPRALALVCARLHLAADVADLRRRAGTSGEGTSLAGLASAAQGVGLKARGVQVDGAALRRLSGPALAWVDGDHYVAVLSVDGDRATIHDPNRPREEDIPTDVLLLRSGGVLLTLSREDGQT